MSEVVNYDVKLAVKRLLIIMLVVAAVGVIGVVFIQLRYQVLMQWEYYFEGLLAVLLYLVGILAMNKVGSDNESKARRRSVADLLSHLRKALVWEYSSPYVGIVVAASVAVIMGEYFADLPNWAIVLLVSVGLLALHVYMTSHNANRVAKLKAEIAQLKARTLSDINQSI